MEHTNSLNYIKYFIFHPIDGFYDLKHEKRGRISVSILIVMAVIITNIIKRQFTGFIFNINDIEKMNILMEIMGVVLPFMLFCISNWAVTTLMDGDGSFKDIVIFTGYSMVPLIIIQLPAVLLSNVLTIREFDFLMFFNNFALVWFAILLILGSIVTHQYSIKKGIITLVVSILSMGIIIFIVFLFFTLLDKIYDFFATIGKEIMLRRGWE